MKVICIADHFEGMGPRFRFGDVLRVKQQFEDGELMYEFKEAPFWAYSACGFFPLSNICGVKVLTKKKKGILRRMATQLTLAFKLL